jgi:KaiC/GvpD/RAD55 family RecA-like ATPase
MSARTIFDGYVPGPRPPDDDEAPPPEPVVDPVGILRTEIYTGERYPTRIAPLDELLGGGLAPGFAFAVAGAPGEGKTLLFVQLAAELLLQGAVVVVLAGDEDRSGIAQRIGQYLGFEKDELNSTHAETLAALEEKLAGRVIRIFPDPDHPPVTVEDVEAVLIRLAVTNPDALLVLVVDSIQTVKCAASHPDDAETAAVTKVVEALRGIKKRTGALVLATSEAPRSSYASRDPGMRTRAIASFAGSRTPEFRFDVLAYIGTVATEGGDERARLEITKNRLGHRKGPVTLTLDRDRARWLPVDTAVVEMQREERETREKNERDQKARLDRRAQVKALVAAGPPEGRSLVSLKEAWRGRARDLVPTIGVMVEERIFEEFSGPVPEGGGRRPKCYRFGGGGTNR